MSLFEEKSMMKNVRVVWLDANFDETNNKYRSYLTELRTIVNNINTFTDADQSIDFVTDVDNERILMIISSEFKRNIIANIHDIPQLHTIFIFSNNKSKCDESKQQLSKVKGVYNQIQSICKSLHEIIEQWEQNMIPMSFVTVDSIDALVSARCHALLDKCFIDMYLLKDTTFGINYDNDATKLMKALATYARQVYANDPVRLQKIDRFEHEFHEHTLLWWYTYDYFLFSMLNQALRTLDIQLIIRLAFIFVQLSHQIKQLHQRQAIHYKTSFTVYRTQTMSEVDFQELQRAKRGLLSFNSFLSTTMNKPTLQTNSNEINILFIMQINPTLNIKPFATLDQNHEKQMLFDMHTVFRIGEIRQTHSENVSLWHVDLTLIANDDPILVALDNRIEEETHQASGWDQLGELLIEARELNKAEELYQILIKETSDDRKKLWLNASLGRLYGNMGSPIQAIAAFQTAITILEKIEPLNQLDLALFYTNIGLEHYKVGEYSQALMFHELALNIRQNNLVPGHFAFSHSYINLGSVYLEMKQWSKALFYFEKGQEILQKTFSSTHPAVKNCIVGIKMVKQKMLEEEKKKNEHNQTKTYDTGFKLNHRRRSNEDECTIFGRNHFSFHINESNEKVQYALYWLDLNTHDQRDLEAELCHIIPLMERFDNVEECETEIKTTVNSTIVLIVAASLAMQFIPLIHDIKSITKIFIYSVDGNPLDYGELTNTYKKIIRIVLTQHDLIEQIAEDWEDKEKRSVFLFGAVNHWDVSLESREHGILWFKLLISFLTRLENKGNGAKNDLIEFMRSSYRDNAKQLENINKFEQDYRPTDAINWYTRDFCLYRLVNKAFRLGNINSLFSLRLFIQDLYVQLQLLHQEQCRLRCETKQPIFRSFRGQAMLKSELQYLSVGKYVTVNSFFSTSTDREQAFGFLVGGTASTDQVLVFFIVNANMSLKTMPFANISAVSNSMRENEVLYAPGILFKIKSIRFDKYDDVYVIELDLCEEKDLPLREIYDSYNIGNKHEINLYDFCMLLNNMGEYKKAEKYILRSMNELAHTSDNPVQHYHALGRTAYNLDDYDKAVSYYETALDKQMQISTKDYITLAQIYNDLAEGHCKLNRISSATDFNAIAIEFASHIEDVHRRYDLLSSCNHTTGKIYLLSHAYDMALQSLQTALSCRQLYYPANHPHIAEIYFSIGMVYSEMEQNSKALEIFAMVRDRYLDIFPLTHPYIGDIIYNFALTQLKKHERNDLCKNVDPSSYFSEAYNIFQHALPAKSSRFLRAKKTLVTFTRAQAHNRGTDLRIVIATPASILF